MIDIESLDKRCSKKTHIKRLAKDLSNIDLDFSYKSDFKNTKDLRDFVDVISDTVWMPEKWKKRFVLIIDEMNNNAIEYWSRETDRNRITIKVVKKNHILDLKIEVEDTGKWKNPKKAAEMYKLKEEKLKKWFENHNSIRGRWLFLIIENTVDRLYFEDSKEWWLIVWVEKIIDLNKAHI